MEGNMMDSLLKNSDEWSRIKGIEIVDPDGWDRRNLSESWSELISEDEFDARAMVSTIMKQS